MEQNKIMDQTEELKNKFVAVLNKKIPAGVLMNALAHMAAGVAGGYSNIAEMKFDSYFDQNGGEHKSISDHPFIVLAADNSNQIRTLRNEFLAAGIHFVDFTNTMTIGTYLDQRMRTKNTPEEQLEYYGICAFGDKTIISQLTRKFSLWR